MMRRISKSALALAVGEVVVAVALFDLIDRGKKHEVFFGNDIPKVIIGAEFHRDQSQNEAERNDAQLCDE